jgi:hypothetical protein
MQLFVEPRSGLVPRVCGSVQQNLAETSVHGLPRERGQYQQTTPPCGVSPGECSGCHDLELKEFSALTVCRTNLNFDGNRAVIDIGREVGPFRVPTQH